MSPDTDATPCTCEKLKFRILLYFLGKRRGIGSHAGFRGHVSIMNYGKFLRHILDLINTIHSKVLAFCHLLHHFLASTTQSKLYKRATIGSTTNGYHERPTIGRRVEDHAFLT